MFGEKEIFETYSSQTEKDSSCPSVKSQLDEQSVPSRITSPVTNFLWNRLESTSPRVYFLLNASSSSTGSNTSSPSANFGDGNQNEKDIYSFKSVF